MALPNLDATFASAADQPRRYMLAQWLVNETYTGTVADYYTLPEYHLWAKIAVAVGAPRGEADYINLPKNYIWKDIYDSVSGTTNGLIQWNEKQALGHIAAAYRGDTGNPANLATYINWPWRYQIASITTQITPDADALSFISASGATNKSGIDQFVKDVKNLGIWESIVFWPLRSGQNAGTGTTVYSLGGLGTYNGTLINGPTLGDNGLDINSTGSQSISIPSPLSDFSNGHSWFIVMNATGPSPTLDSTVNQLLVSQFGAVLQVGASGTGGTINFMINARTTGTRYTSNLAAYGDVRNKFAFLCHNSSSKTTTYKTVGFTVPNGSSAASAQSYSGSNMTITATGNGRNTSSLIMVTSAQFDLNSSLQSSLESTYKQNLGTGLSLP